MARPKKGDTGRSETLSIRLDPQARFVLELLARWRGQTITSVVERAIMEEGSKVVGPDKQEVWRSLWSISEGERALASARVPELFPTYEETKRLKFAELHWPFFFADASKKTFVTYYVDLFWPDIDHYVSLFDATRDRNFWAAGEAMQDALAAARIEPPDWPPADHEDAMVTDSPRKRAKAPPLPFYPEDLAALEAWEAIEDQKKKKDGGDT